MSGSKPKFKAVIFDCDGVLVESEIIANRLEAELKTELGFPITLDEQLKTFVGLGMSHPVVQAEIKRLPPHYLQTLDERVKVAYINELEAVRGVNEVLKQLSVPKCVASSSEPEWLTMKLEHTGLASYFGKSVFDGRMVSRSKPAPDLFLLALERMGWDATTTLVIEDSVAGVQAGRAAGLTVWGFVGGQHIRPGHTDRLLEVGAHKIISEFHEVLEAVS